MKINISIMYQNANFLTFVSQNKTTLWDKVLMDMIVILLYSMVYLSLLNTVDGKNVFLMSKPTVSSVISNVFYKSLLLSLAVYCLR